MIQYLKIGNFGSIKDEVEMNFEVADQMEEDAYEVKMPDGRRLLKLVYIYGANASGKTTVLEAFGFLRRLLLKPITNKAGELNYAPFLFREKPYEVPSFLECAFYLEGIRYIYTVRFNSQSILDEKVVFYQTAKPTELFSRKTDPDKRLAKIEFGSKIKVPVRERDLLESNTLHNNTVFGAYAKTNVDIPELEKLNRWFSYFLQTMVTADYDLTDATINQIDATPDTNKWINAFLHKADSQISEVVISETDTNPFQVDVVHKVAGNKSYTLPMAVESHGTRRYFGLGGLLYNLIHGEHFLCIDELETALHPDLVKHFLQTYLMNSGKAQLLITTHQTSLMEDQDFIRRDALWFSEKGSDGAVTLYSAADFDSTTLRKDASLINAYKSGRLGAKPNLGSPYLVEE